MFMPYANNKGAWRTGQSVGFVVVLIKYDNTRYINTTTETSSLPPKCGVGNARQYK